MIKHKMDSIMGLLIKDSQPTIGLVLNSLLPFKPNLAIFEDFPTFKIDADLTHNDFNSINKNSQVNGDYGTIWTVDLIRSYIDKIAFNRNLVHFYNKEIYTTTPRLKDHNWDIVYFCYDSTWVEIYSKSITLMSSIKKMFKTDEVAYPGTIPDGMLIET